MVVDKAINISALNPEALDVGDPRWDEVVEENERTYHIYKDGKYMLPNDEIERNRLDMQHKMWEITLDGKLLLSPVDPNPRQILDIGTGTGSWAIDFAHQYQMSNVIGIDLSPTQSMITSPNIQFLIADAEDPWRFTHKFSYIHGRTLATCFLDPSSIICKAFTFLEPGGYMELQDMCLQTSDDASLSIDTALKKWQDYIAEAVKETGRVWTNVPNYKRWMIDAGFEDVKEYTYRWPSNQWSVDPKEKLLGAWTQAQIEGGMVESVSTRLFMAKLGWSKERLERVLAYVKRDTKNPDIKAYSPISVVYGRNPRLAN